MYQNEREMMIEAGKSLDRYGLIALSGGNVSVRVSDNEFLITPSGMIYEELTADDLVLLDLDCNVLQGDRRPSVDSIAISYILKNRPDVNAVIHTHQPYATGLGLVLDEIPCNLTTLANTTKGAVKVAPYSSAASEEMGVQTVDNLGEQLAVVLKHHGVVTVGKDLKEALYAAVYLEEACKTLSVAMSCGKGELPLLNDEQIKEAINVFNNYGQ